jgi:hypothetical protein
MKTYAVVLSENRSEQYAEYRIALHAAISMCDIDYPVYVKYDGKIIHRFIMDCFGRLVDTHTIDLQNVQQRLMREEWRLAHNSTSVRIICDSEEQHSDTKNND